MRLDKLLADMQIGTRNKVKQLIRQGAVTVDGAVQTAPDLKVDPNRQKICCFGKDLRYTKRLCDGAQGRDASNGNGLHRLRTERIISGRPPGPGYRRAAFDHK